MASDKVYKASLDPLPPLPPPPPPFDAPREVADVAEDQGEPFLTGPPSLGDFMGAGPPGVVVDPAVARDAPCVGYELAGPGTGPGVVFVRGIAGPLDADQVETYCETVTIGELSPEQMARLSAFHDAAEACRAAADEADIPEAERFPAHLSCMANELRERGQKL